MNFINCPAAFYNPTPECDAMKKMVSELKENATCAKVYDEKFFIYEHFMFLPKHVKQKYAAHLEQ
jgi:hypothetical protein